MITLITFLVNMFTSTYHSKDYIFLSSKVYINVPSEGLNLDETAKILQTWQVISSISVAWLKIGFIIKKKALILHIFTKTCGIKFFKFLANFEIDGLIREAL